MNTGLKDLKMDNISKPDTKRMPELQIICPITAKLSGKWMDDVREMLSQLIDVIRNSRCFNLDYDIPFDINLFDSIDELSAAFIHIPKTQYMYEDAFIVLRVDMELFASVEFVFSGDTHIGIDKPGLAVNYISERLCSVVHSAVFASHLAHPGLINLEPPLVFVDGEFKSTSLPVSWILVEAMEMSNHYEWPEVRNIALNDVLKWLETISGYVDGSPTGPVGRALGALSHILCKPVIQYSPIDLTWAMVGLEALYGRDTAGLTKQLVENTELLLGPREKNKKSISKLYGYRSSFLHGGVDIPMKFNFKNDSNSKENFDQDSYLNWAFATRVLVASLQELVTQNKNSLEFYTVMKQ